MLVHRLMKCVGLLAFVAAFSLFGASQASAQNRIYQCNGCTDAQAGAIATGLGMGNHLVGDFKNNILYGFHVTREPNGTGGYIYELDPQTPTSLQQQAFADYYQLITVDHANSIIVNVPRYPRPTGYPGGLDLGTGIQWASQTNYTTLLNNWLSDIQSGNADGSWMGGPAVIAMTAMQIGISVDNYTNTMTVRLQVNDGSIISYSWTNGEGSLISVQDVYGNFIPIRNFNGPTNFNGSYNIPPAGNPVYFNQLLNYLNQLGAGLSNTNQGGTFAIICSGAKCFITYPN